MRARPSAVRRAGAAVAAGVLLLAATTPLAYAQAAARPKTATSPSPATFTRISAAAAKAREAGRVDEAIGLYRRGVAMRPAWDEGHWYLGSLLYEQGRPQEALAAFGRVLRLHGDHAGALAMSGLCAFQLGEHERALRLLLQARKAHIERTPELATVVRYHTGILLTRFEEFEAGHQVLSELVAEGQESPHAITALGLNVLRMPMLPAEMPSTEGDRVRLAGQAAQAMASRQASRARELLEALVAAYGRTPHVHYVWGVFLLSEDPVRALEAFRTEIAQSPSHVPARLQIAFELVKQGEAAAALPYAVEAAAIAPDQLAPRLALGQAHLGTGDVAAAIVELERAVRLAPESAQPHYVLALAYARAGRQADAARERAAFSRLSKGARPPR